MTVFRADARKESKKGVRIRNRIPSSCTVLHKKQGLPGFAMAANDTNVSDKEKKLGFTEVEARRLHPQITAAFYSRFADLQAQPYSKDSLEAGEHTDFARLHLQVPTFTGK